MIYKDITPCKCVTHKRGTKPQDKRAIEGQLEERFRFACFLNRFYGGLLLKNQPLSQTGSGRGFFFLKKVLVKNTDLKKSYFEWEDKLKENVTVKSFTDSIHSAISGNLELAELFNSLFKKAEGERKCQLKK